MLSASVDFKDKIDNGNPIFTKCLVTLQDGTNLTLNANNFAFDDGFEMNTATSNTTSFDIGACITGELRLKLLNYNGEFDDYSFDKAKVVAYVYSPELTEEIKKGVFYVDSQDFNSGVVSLVCYDKMTAFDKAFSNSTSTAKTASQWVTELANSHNISLKNARFNNSTLELKIPTDGDYTEKQMLSYILQCTGNFAKIDEDEQLRIDWYEVTSLKPIIDAQTFTNPSEDVIDAGDFADIDNVNLIYTGGTFNERKNESGVITRLFSHSIAVDDVEVTGVRTVLEDGTEVLAGKEGYVLRIEKNPLITEKNQADITQRLWNVCIGLMFRPMTISILSNPLIQSGDILMVVIKGSIYYTIATNVDYSQGNYTVITCGAESPTKNASKYGTPSLQIDKKVNGIIDTRLTDYDRGIMEMVNLISQSLGTFTTKDILDDGSTIYYMHDKPTLADSKKIWKFTADGMMTSNDGGNTWTSGWTVDGKLAMNLIEAVGISFDWAKGGTLTLGGASNGNGTMIIYDKNNTAVGYWGNGGIIAITGIIADWHIGDGLTSGNVKINGTNYKAWMNIPRQIGTKDSSSETTWIYSTQNDNYGKEEFYGSWFVNALGQMHFAYADNVTKGGIVGAIPFLDGVGSDARKIAYMQADIANDGIYINKNLIVGGKIIGTIPIESLPSIPASKITGTIPTTIPSSISVSTLTVDGTGKIDITVPTYDNRVSISNSLGMYIKGYEFSVYGAVAINYSLYVGGGIDGTLNTSSDRNAKHDISSLDLEKTAEFIYSLNPCQFKYNNGTSDRFHHGLIAQEVKESMGDNDWGLYVDKSIKEANWKRTICDKDGNPVKNNSEAKLALSYQELIPDLIATVQSQNERIKALENEVMELKEMVKTLAKGANISGN